MIRIPAPAKVNIALDIVGRNPDGYHQMRMINHTLSLADRITIKPRNELFIRCNDRRVPLNERNIVYRAAQKLREFSGVDEGADIFIDKHIPMEAGLAGGSADAAAALKGLTELWHLKISGDALNAIALSCGADVPYCLHGGTALAEGVGERLTPLPALPQYEVLVVKPSINIATPWAFGLADDCADLTHPNIDGALKCIRNNDFEGAAQYYGNSFESVIFPIYPEIAEIKNTLAETGAFYVTMTGSGSTVIAYYKEKAQADAAKALFEGKMFVCRAECTSEV